MEEMWNLSIVLFVEWKKNKVKSMLTCFKPLLNMTATANIFTFINGQSDFQVLLQKKKSIVFAFLYTLQSQTPSKFPITH